MKKGRKSKKRTLDIQPKNLPLPPFMIGATKAKQILESSSVNPDIRVNKLSEEEIISIRNEIAENYSVEGELRGQVSRNIKRLMDIGTYRGLRHKKGLPVRGQNTKNNSRTRKGKKKTVAGKKKATIV